MAETTTNGQKLTEESLDRELQQLLEQETFEPPEEFKKNALLNDESVGGLRIDVDTFKGVVTLSGRVKSQAEKDRAIDLAKRVNGVTEVKDALQIIPPNNS